MNEKELCPELKDYLEWTKIELMPRLKRFMAHVAECPECQKYILEMKDRMSFGLLTIPDEELIKKFKETAEE